MYFSICEQNNVWVMQEVEAVLLKVSPGTRTPVWVTCLCGRYRAASRCWHVSGPSVTTLEQNRAEQFLDFEFTTWMLLVPFLFSELRLQTPALVTVANKDSGTLMVLILHLANVLILYWFLKPTKCILASPAAGISTKSGQMWFIQENDAEPSYPLW